MGNGGEVRCRPDPRASTLNPLILMCVIIACPTQKRPSLEILKACERTNPHGSGLAWVQKRMVYYIKGLSAGAMLGR